MTKEELNEFNDLLRLEDIRGNPITDLDEFSGILKELSKIAEEDGIIYTFITGDCGISFTCWNWTLKAGKLAGDIELIDLDE